MKKGLLKVALLALTTSLFVAGCGQNNNSSTSGEPASVPSTSEVTPSTEPSSTEPAEDHGSINGIAITSPGAKSDIYVGETLQLKASVTGMDGKNGAYSKEVTWAVAKVASGEKDADGKDVMVASDVASVSETGLVTALKPGSATITATSVQDPTKVGKFKLTVAEITYAITITNEEDLKKDWRQYDEARTLSLSIVASDGTVLNVAELAAEGEIEVEATGTVFTVVGLGLNPTGHGTSTVTVTYGKATASIELTVSELVMAENISALSALVARKADAYADNAYTAPEGQPDVWGLKAVVVGVTTEGAFLDDGTGIVYAYSSEAAQLKVGNYVFGAAGKLQRYHQNLFELGSWKTISGELKETAPATKYSTLEVLNLTAAVYGAIDFDNASNVLNDWVPVKFVGTLFKSGKYFCFFPEDVKCTQDVPTSAEAHGEKDIMLELQATDTKGLVEGKVYEVEGMASYDGKYTYVGVYASSIKEADVKPTALTAKINVEHLYVGTDANIEVGVTPSYSTDKAFSYTSSDATVATVDENGKVHGVKEGTANITIALKSNAEVKVVLPIKVEAEPDPLVSVALDKAELALKEGQVSAELVPTITDSKGGSNHVSTVKWTSSDETIATVDKDGKVTAVKAGTATITCTTDGKDAEGKALTDTCAVTVAAWNYGTKDAPLTKAQAIALIDENTPAGANTKAKITVTGVVKSVSVSDGRYTIWVDGTSKNDGFEFYSALLAEGVEAPYVNDTITATGWGQNYKGTYELTNKDSEGKYDNPSIISVVHADSAVTFAGDANLTLTVKAGETAVTSGGNVKNGTVLTVTPVLAEGYAVESFVANNKDVAANKDGTYSVTVTGPTTIAAKSILSGTVKLVGDSILKVNDEKTFTATTYGVDGDTYTWNSSDATVATVANGKVTALKSGATTITATSVKDNTKFAKIQVVVCASSLKLDSANLLGYSGSQVAYNSSAATKTVDGIEYGYIQLGAYGDGIQMRCKDGTQSSLYNTAAFASNIAAVKVSYNTAKTIANNKAVVEFGTTAFTSANTETAANVSFDDNGNCVIANNVEGAKFFKFSHATTSTSLYIAAIEIYLA